MDTSWRPTILVVDDEPGNRLALASMLSDSYRILEAPSGSGALEVLRREAVDLVLLDVIMPEENGYDICRRIKLEHNGVPVVMVTSFVDQAHRNEGLESGADDFLGKPVDKRELLLRVRSFLRIRGRLELMRHQVRDLTKLQSVKDDLVSLLVHDMRSPLSAVVAHLQFIQEELGPSAGVSGDIEQAMRAANRLVDVLEDALQVRLLEDGALPIRRAAVDLRQVIQETVAALFPLARRKRIEVRCDYEGYPVVSVDGKLLRRALENLLSNALKYTDNGGDVVITLRRTDGEVQVEVADRGPGVPLEFRTALFEKFGSLEAKQGDERRGIGLGLYLVRLVAEGHHGAVSVDDRAGGGARFRLTLATSP
jgi:two-component system sensor histidine kinase/response regulator